MNEKTGPAPTQEPPITAVAVVEPVTVQTRTHHKRGPSKMNYLDDCAAFTSRPGTSEAAEEGTFLHGIMEDAVKNVIARKAKTTLEQIAAWVVKTHELTDEQIECLRFCCKRVDTFLARKPTGIQLEIKLHARRPDGTEFNSGYLDLLLVFGKVGIILDYKFGYEPVRPASDNLQGTNYALGVLQQFPALDRVGVEFIQPRLSWTTSHVFERRSLFAIYERLAQVVERADYVAAHPEDAQRYMRPGHYCSYCALAGSCTVLANHRAVAASKYASLPVPTSFKGLELSNPSDVALARYWVDIVETGLEEVKAKAFEVAEANGGELRCTLPDGREIVYEVQERSMDRTLGSAQDVAEALKDFCSPQEILGAAKLALGKLEPIAKQARVTVAAARGEKLTKKAAWEEVCSTLEALGLLTRPDGKVRYLKQKKEATKQIEKV